MPSARVRRAGRALQFPVVPDYSLNYAELCLALWVLVPDVLYSLSSSLACIIALFSRTIAYIRISRCVRTLQFDLRRRRRGPDVECTQAADVPFHPAREDLGGD